MSRSTEKINKVTSTITSVSIRIIVVAAILFLFLKGMKTAYSFGYGIFKAEAVDEFPGKDVSVIITDGLKASAVGDILVAKGLITNKRSFIIQSIFFEAEMTPGKYTFNTSMTSRQILEMLDKGPNDAAEE